MSEGPPGDSSPAGAQRRAGIRVSLARLAAAGVSVLSTRAELFAVELTEERERLTRRLAFVVVGGLLIAFAVLFVGVFVIALLWESHRLWAIVGVAAAHLALGAYLLHRARSMGSDASSPFAATIEELKKDRASIERALADPDDAE